jgi:hypothetical protein
VSHEGLAGLTRELPLAGMNAIEPCSLVLLRIAVWTLNAAYRQCKECGATLCRVCRVPWQLV